MKKLKIYIDTSVVSHLEHEDAPEKRKDTQKLWENIKNGHYSVIISDVMLAELFKTPEPKRSLFAYHINEIPYENIEVTDDILSLAEKFIDFGILKQKSLDDCRHIAAAIVTDCDLIVSWNFKHIVNPKTIRGAKVIAASEGYKDIIICTPTMLVEEANDDE
ncbi:MAG: PIN domain-containing protein [Oscillospiraceae bacterium]|jgi:predicted nucleic acid-binding protein|nr:PIN domain-containing protein [Oscillospiraceae bacterium]